MIKTLQLDDDLKGYIVTRALEHIKAVEDNPDIEFKDVDPHDAWFTASEAVEFNVHERDLGFSESKDLEWYCSAYEILPTYDGYNSTNADHMVNLFTYKNGKVKFSNE